MTHKVYRFDPVVRQEYLDLWATMKFSSIYKEQQAANAAKKFLKNVDRYLLMQQWMNIPAAFIMCVHERESAGNWNTYLGNGQPLDKITTIVPIGRGPFPTFEAGAWDAFILIQKMGKVPLTEWDEAGLAWYLEKMNGFGYRARGLRSPYLWGGTNHQQPGKYVRDGVFSRQTWDSQLGGMAVYAKIIEARPELKLGTGEVYA